MVLILPKIHLIALFMPVKEANVWVGTEKQYIAFTVMIVGTSLVGLWLMKIVTSKLLWKSCVSLQESRIDLKRAEGSGQRKINP